MQKKYNQGFRIARLIAKSVGLPMALIGILIFAIQTNVGEAGIIVLFVGSLLWALDTEWTTLDDCKALYKEIKEHRQPNSKRPTT